MLQVQHPRGFASRTPTGDNHPVPSPRPSGLDALRARIRATPTGLLIAEQTGEALGAHADQQAAWRVYVTIDGPTGRLIGNVHRHALEHADLGLALGDESEEHPQLHVSPEPIDPERDAGAFRYLARFGEPDASRLCRLVIHSAKWRGEVFDGASIDLRNPIADKEPGLLRLLNADRTALARAIERERGHLPPDVTAVGVDEAGIDIRLGRRIIRIEHRAGNDPQSSIERWLKGQGEGGQR